MYCIYKITNMSNGKEYIGQTCKKLHERMSQHKWDATHSESHMYNAPLQIDIRNFGVDNFMYEIVATCDDKDKADELEDAYIIKLNTLIPNGYNRDRGGCKRSETTKTKISESHKGLKKSEEHKRHIKEATTGTRVGGDNPKARPVLCVETGMIFDTVRYASEWCGNKSLESNIIKCCKGKRNTTGGYHWRYAND